MFAKSAISQSNGFVATYNYHIFPNRTNSDKISFPNFPLKISITEVFELLVVNLQNTLPFSGYKLKYTIYNKKVDIDFMNK